MTLNTNGWPHSRLWRFLYIPRVPEPEAMADEAEASAYESQVAEPNLSQSDQRLVNRVLAHRPVRDVVDIGTGPGQIPVLLTKSSPDLSVIGVDLSEAMLALARRNAAEAGVDNRVHFIRAEATRTCLPAHSADVVICNSALHHFTAPVSVFNEMHRLLRPGGLAVIRDLLRPSRFLSAAHIAFFGRHYRGKTRALFGVSVLAAYTVAEVRELIAESNLAGAKVFREDMVHLIASYQAKAPVGLRI